MSASPTSSSLERKRTKFDPNLIVDATVRGIGTLTAIGRDGRPQFSSVTYTFDPATNLARMSLSDDPGIADCLRRDSRASIFISGPDGSTYVVLEGTLQLSPVAMAPNDRVVEELIEVFRAIQGTDHPQWQDYRAAMVADHRLVARLRVEHVYGVARSGSAGGKTLATGKVAMGKFTPTTIA